MKPLWEMRDEIQALTAKAADSADSDTDPWAWLESLQIPFATPRMQSL